MLSTYNLYGIGNKSLQDFFLGDILQKFGLQYSLLDPSQRRRYEYRSTPQKFRQLRLQHAYSLVGFQDIKISTFLHSKFVEHFKQNSFDIDYNFIQALVSKLVEMKEQNLTGKLNEGYNLGAILVFLPGYVEMAKCLRLL